MIKVLLKHAGQMSEKDYKEGLLKLSQIAFVSNAKESIPPIITWSDFKNVNPIKKK